MTKDARNLRVVIVLPAPVSADLDDTEQAELERSRILRIGLLEAGYNVVATFPGDSFLPDRIAQIQPDMIVVDAESQGRDILEHVVMATRDERRPIVMFSDDEDTSYVRKAISAGVSTYVAAGTPQEHIKTVIDVALARFEHEEQLHQELANAKSQLEERKLVDRAKGLLMSRQGLSEQDAYQRLRKAAMNKGIRVSEVAQRLIDAADLLG
ncbi:ANTAR domain-containing response regulator [Aquabacterium sp.]|uniref:ANTAR domain-containing response regulator n=1 Tax=Aquabacterium sp. TaxID=1872578 RepID=UPI0035B1F468